MPSSEKPKTRCSYEKEVRAQAKAGGLGLITVSVTHANGDRYEVQVAANASDCRFAKWAGVLLSEEEARPLPDLEQFVREHVEKS